MERRGRDDWSWVGESARVNWGRGDQWRDGGEVGHTGEGLMEERE